MNKKTIVSVMVVAMLFAVSLYFIGGTYARYVSKFDGKGNVEVAKWNIGLTTGGSAENMTLTLEAEHNDNVVGGKIAPGVKAVGEVEISLEGTEVAVDVFAEVDEKKITEAINTALGGGSVENSDIKTTVTVTAGEHATNIAGKTSGSGKKEDPFVIKLPDPPSGFTSEDTVKVKVQVEWTNDDTHSLDHTKIGEKADSLQNLEIPVTLYAVQHLETTFDPVSLSS